MELSGSLDISTAAALHERLAAGDGVLHAARVTRADTAALQVLLAYVREVRRGGGTVVWEDPSEVLVEAARLLGLDRELGL